MPPIGTQRTPGARTQAFVVCVAVLRDDCGNAIRIGDRQIEADGRAVIEDVHRKASQRKFVHKALNRLCQAGKGKLIALSRFDRRKSERRQIWCDQVKAAGKLWHQVPEIVRRVCKAVEQQKNRLSLRTGFTVEDICWAYLNSRMTDVRHAANTYAVPIGVGGTTTSTSPVDTSHTRPEISHAPGIPGIARSAATSVVTAARGSVTVFVLRSASGT